MSCSYIGFLGFWFKTSKMHTGLIHYKSGIWGVLDFGIYAFRKYSSERRRFSCQTMITTLKLLSILRIPPVEPEVIFTPFIERKRKRRNELLRIENMNLFQEQRKRRCRKVITTTRNYISMLKQCTMLI